MNLEPRVHLASHQKHSHPRVSDIKFHNLISRGFVLSFLKANSRTSLPSPRLLLTDFRCVTESPQGSLCGPEQPLPSRQLVDTATAPGAGREGSEPRLLVPRALKHLGGH